MTSRTLLSAAFVAIAFAAWPLIGRQARVSGPWMATLVMAGSALLIATLSAPQLGTWPASRALWVLGAAAVANGLAVYVYASSAADPSVPTGPYIVVVSVLQVAAVPFLAWALPGGQAPTLRQAAGFAFAAVAVYLLAKS
jgi:CBS domain containing-hemolysin-like protein